MQTCTYVAITSSHLRRSLARESSRWTKATLQRDASRSAILARRSVSIASWAIFFGRGRRSLVSSSLPRFVAAHYVLYGFRTTGE